MARPALPGLLGCRARSLRVVSALGGWRVAARNARSGIRLGFADAWSGTVRIERVVPVGRLPGILHCPSCGWPLGDARNPATGYLVECSGCKAKLVMRIEGAAIMVTVKQPSNA
jgi:hypothetical protein